MGISLTEQQIQSLFRLGGAVLIAIGAFLLLKILVKIIHKALQRSTIDEVLYTFVINCVRVIYWVAAVISILSYLHVPTAPFLAIFGSAGVAVALALKDSLGNFAGGVLILVTKPFVKGDHIENLEIEGLVEKIDLLYSTLKTFDNKVITIPNGKLSNSTIVNYTKAERRRVDCTFSIGASDDIQKAKDLLGAVAESNPDILQDPAYFVGVSGQTESGLTSLALRVWCETEHYWDIKYFLMEQVKLAFDEAGILAPNPQIDVHLKK